MKKRFISVFLVLAVASIMIVTGCSTMRYETFDSGLEKDAEPYSEEEQALRDQLWDDAIAIEDFEDAELEPEFQYLADLDTVEIKDGVLVATRGQHDKVFDVDLSDRAHSSVIYAVKTHTANDEQGVYFAVQLGAQGRIEEPVLFFWPHYTSLAVWQQTDDTWRSVYHSERSHTNDWFVVELRKTPEGIAFYLNGDLLGTADVKGEPMRPITFNVVSDTGPTLVDYLILK